MAQSGKSGNPGHPAVAEFERLVKAIEAGEFKQAVTYRNRLFKLGWVISTRPVKAAARDVDAAGDPAPRRGLLSGLNFGGA